MESLRNDLDSLQSWFHQFGGSNQHPAPNNVQFRSSDGSGNNVTQIDLNQAGSDFTRVGPANFTDGLDAMPSGPNPRMISNVVVAGNGDLANPEGLCGMMYAWGQFIDHDLDLANQDPSTNIGITVAGKRPEPSARFNNPSQPRVHRSRYWARWQTRHRNQLSDRLARRFHGVWV